MLSADCGSGFNAEAGYYGYFNGCLDESCMYKHLLENTRDIMLVMSDDGSLVEVNSAAEAAYGYTRAELLQMNIMQLRAADTINDMSWQFAQALAAGITFETRHSRKDGTTFPVEVNSSSFVMGEKRFVFSLVHDISTRYQQYAGTELLRKVDRLIIAGEPTKVVLQYICDNIVKSLGYACAYITIKEPDGSLRITANEGLPFSIVPQLHSGWDEHTDEYSPTRVAIRLGKVSVAEVGAAKAGQMLFAFKEMGIELLGSAPLKADGKTFGALTVGSRQRPADLYNAKSTFTWFAGQIASSFLAAQRHEQLRLHTHICNSMPNPVFVLDPNGLIIWLNEAFTATTGYTLDEAYGRRPQDLHYQDSPPHQRLADIWNIIQAGQTWYGERSNRKKDGGYYIAEESITPVFDRDGALIYCVVIQQDITERKRHEEELYHQAVHDPLTGVLNRRALAARLNNTVEQAKNGMTGHFLLVDIDDFKLVNDTLGHSVGDELLIKMAHRLAASLRSTDSLARLGGDEFAIVLSNTTLAEAEVIAARVLEQIKSIEVCSRGQRFSPSASIGIATINGQLQAEQVLALADSALYDAKGKGKNRIIVHNDTANVPLLSHTGQWVTRIKDAIKNDRFILHFQPIVELSNLSVVQNEALIRLRDGDELISPGIFLPIAEEFGLAADVDRWVIQKVLEIVPGHNLPISVNLSGYTLNDPTMRSYIKDAIVNAKIVPNQLTFELTESMALDNTHQLQVWMNEMRSFGCKFALDDFGKGFSSFTYLKTIETDYVKIDAAFTQGLTKNHVDRDIIGAVVAIARSLGRKVVAEGVEDKAALKMLTGLAIDYVQGYYLGKPEPLEHYTARTHVGG